MRQASNAIEAVEDGEGIGWMEDLVDGDRLGRLGVGWRHWNGDVAAGDVCLCGLFLVSGSSSVLDNRKLDYTL